MITVKKLLSLKERTRLRKISLVLSENAHRAKTGRDVDLTYINSILPLADLPAIPLEEFSACTQGGAVPQGNPRGIESLEYSAYTPGGASGSREEASQTPLDAVPPRDSESLGANNGVSPTPLNEVPVSGSRNDFSFFTGLRLAFRLEDLAQKIRTRLGAEPSDWDATDDAGGLDASKRLIQDKILVLDRIRSPYNVGAIFRSADSFGIREIVLVEGTASPLHPHARRTARGCVDTVAWRFSSEAEVLDLFCGYETGEVIALELGGDDINTFCFPVRGVVVLGSEEFGVSPDILKRCLSRVSIPMAGTKGSLNVSVSAGILMQRWFAVGEIVL